MITRFLVHYFLKNIHYFQFLDINVVILGYIIFPTSKSHPWNCSKNISLLVFDFVRAVVELYKIYMEVNIFQEYSYCWAGQTIREIASYKPDMSGIATKTIAHDKPDNV